MNGTTREAVADYIPRGFGALSDSEILRRLELPEDSDRALRIS